MILGLVVGLISSTFFTESCSSIMIELDVSDLWDIADEVLIVDVKGISTHRGSAGMIYRKVNARIVESLTGPFAEASVEIIVMGGTIGQDGVWVEDEPDFTFWERALVFLNRFEGDATLPGVEGYRVVGGPQGKFNVIGDIARSVTGKVIRLDEPEVTAPRLAISNFTIVPERLELWEDVNISLRVVNSGAEAASYNVTIQITGQYEADEGSFQHQILNSRLEGGEDRIESFRFTPSIRGAYNVGVELSWFGGECRKATSGGFLVSPAFVDDGHGSFLTGVSVALAFAIVLVVLRMVSSRQG
ncbi:MAG: hypothetical protein JSV27_08730 [Candidatus Bathyarchaeota archaeon]|nr:MAG: hypothetical protein JSV27_08730 [Candidatus Bathyarchaeota archaeon]